MRVLYVRPPKYLWPYMNEMDNFLLSQAMVYLGAELRRRGHEVTLLDCGPAKVGWKSLAEIIRKTKPQVVLAGDSETLYEHECGRVFRLAKEIDPSIATIAGGVHFAQNSADCLARYPIDAIVRGEGEITLGETVDAIEHGRDLKNIPGLAIPGEHGECVYTGHRDLIADLDTLPFPAYDLLPMHLFGASKYLFSPGGVTIHHSRGCTDSCNYCACWLQMSKRKGDPADEKLIPRWRTRGVDHVIAEMEVLYYKYQKNCFVFVDDTWNVKPQWSDEFATRLIASKMKTYWFGFMRSDYLVRDDESGLFEKLIASGLSHICIGVERAEDDDFVRLSKHNQDVRRTAHLVPYLRRKYPKLFLQTTFIVGIREDTTESMDKLVRYVRKLAPDYPAFHPMTPVPGTEQFKRAKENGWLDVTDFSRYDWMTPVMGTETMTREEVDYKLWEMNRRVLSLPRIFLGLMSIHKYRRRMYMWWLLVSVRIGWDAVVGFLNPKASVRERLAISEYVGMLRPDWYEA
ncbi:MAG: cobalamin-dependent protein [Deltaproteobacteria bacterium]|nr:cobalamin-dependent protein [Deltaproteobacteria bacterium]